MWENIHKYAKTEWFSFWQQFIWVNGRLVLDNKICNMCRNALKCKDDESTQPYYRLMRSLSLSLTISYSHSQLLYALILISIHKFLYQQLLYTIKWLTENYNYTPFLLTRTYLKFQVYTTSTLVSYEIKDVPVTKLAKLAKLSQILHTMIAEIMPFQQLSCTHIFVEQNDGSVHHFIPIWWVKIFVCPWKMKILFLILTS